MIRIGVTLIMLQAFISLSYFIFIPQVRSPHDDVNSVTSGETTTSDSGRGGSEDDTALPPIAEVPPECGSEPSFFCYYDSLICPVELVLHFYIRNTSSGRICHIN